LSEKVSIHFYLFFFFVERSKKTNVNDDVATGEEMVPLSQVQQRLRDLSIQHQKDTEQVNDMIDDLQRRNAEGEISLLTSS